jgi:hypothetical protein
MKHMPTPSSQSKIDHDLLIEIKTEVGFIRTEVKDLKENFAGRINILETGKTAIGTTEDHEKRIRQLETWGGRALGALFILQMLLAIYLSLRK